MRRMHSSLPTILLLALAVLVVGPAEAKKKKKLLHGIPMVWSPTDDIGDVGVVNLTDLYDITIGVTPFTDKRRDPEVIAKNIEDMDDGVVLEVTTSDDVGAWVSDRFVFVLESLGMTVASTDADVEIEGEIRRFFVEEDNMYEGDVGILLTVKKGDEVLWKGMTNGSAKRWGRSYKADNYFETLSDATLEAIHNAIRDRHFRDALAGKSSKK